MGLFGGKKTTTVNTSQTDVFNTNQSATSNAAPVNMGDGNQTVITKLSDFGAIQEAGKVSQAALNANVAALDANTLTTKNALEFATDATAEAAQLSLSVIQAYTDAAAKTFDDSLSMARAQSKDFADFAESVTKSESQAISEKLITYVGLGLLALAAAFVMKG